MEELANDIDTTNHIAFDLPNTKKDSSKSDRLDGKNLDEYQQWLFKDQSLFTWLLSTISDGVLPRVLNYKHSHEVWEKIHKYFNLVLNRFETPIVEDVEALLLLQEDTAAQESGTEHYNVTANRGRGRGKGRGRGRGRAQNSHNTGKIQCQICDKPNHDATICWYMYDSSTAKPQARGYNPSSNPKPPHFNPYARPTAHLAIPQYFTPTAEFDSMYSASWYPDSGASHHLTYNPHNFGYRASYQGHDQVMMGNDQGVSIHSLGHSQFHSPNNPNVHLKLNDLLLVLDISKNLLSISKFAQDNNVIFEFHRYNCFVKSQDYKKILLEGTVGA
ncbi:retrovirus-related pol polyprotein from transposon TNT 1-94 [Trifolium medium]|uniref:Retrovirus-related pol polyprotein from transposon TNT 1-94 n=1 Tax=Trifolium medium TaxID=97028 RepID=A0A392MDT4_9FABA|nr:retrovirus-related pol polyprotein from transposon TNT 1-94 [Trifolium medium]